MNREERQRTAKKAILAIAGIVILLAVIVGITRIAESRNKVEAVEEPQEGNEEDDDSFYCMALYGQDFIYRDEFETYLFMGTDASGNEEAQGDGYQGSMADFLAMLVVDKTEETYAILQLNRDTMSEVQLLQDDGDVSSNSMQICTGHWYGTNKEESCENMVNVISDMFDQLQIDGYYALPMENIPRLNHMVGGVTVEVLDDFSKVDPTLKKGESVHLSDEQAYTYIRSRYDVGDEENTSRMQRQKQYLDAFAKQLSQKCSEDSKFVLEFYQEFQDTATTDISGNGVSKLAKKLMNYESRGIYQFEGETKLGRHLDDGLEHVEFYPDEDSVISVMTELYGLEPDPDSDTEEE